ncbi:hypothetical protein SELMODRAFT_438154 [Selaginella moellendorffii]|uniref:Uncharacterized protein n=1 Tax=Selaginella moellendorffii TaxID=88036 RepID=D8QUI9_SELML|nr:hypothetical protein SELMODRAFT_438154 [Selaginella moellendorffii]
MACLACAAAASSTANPPHIQSSRRGRPSNAAQSRCSAAIPPAKSSRRGFGLATALSILAGGSFLRAETAVARDIPLFGIRKTVKEAIQEEVQVVEKEVKEIVKESSAVVANEAKVVAGEAKVVAEEAKAALAASASSMDSSSIFAPPVQAGAVVAAELLALAIASSVVRGLVSQPSNPCFIKVSEQSKRSYLCDIRRLLSTNYLLHQSE